MISCTPIKQIRTGMLPASEGLKLMQNNKSWATCLVNLLRRLTVMLAFSVGVFLTDSNTLLAKSKFSLSMLLGPAPLMMDD